MYLTILIISIITIDQWSKWLIRTNFSLYQSKPIIQDFFHFTYVTNEGMAFGLELPGGKIILLFLTIILTIFLAFYLWNEKDGHPLNKYGLALILSGAIGNLIDRAYFGKVVDFLDFMIGDFHWYVFNVADSAVTIGMIIYIFYSINEDKMTFKN
jgi:signal peptidase II